MVERMARRCRIHSGFVNPTFSLGGGYTQESGSVSFYTGYRNYDVWGDLVGTVGLLHNTTDRQIPIGITVQPNNGSTAAWICRSPARLVTTSTPGP